MATILTSGAGAQTQPAPAKKVLVAYYSHSGNTREVARQIAGVSGGELFEIVPVTPYPSDYRTEVDQAKKEIEAGDEVEVNFDTGVITDVTKGTSYQGQAFPPFMQKIIDCEGLVNYINQK